ncbi:MAG TPA: hypothetical protein VF519_07710 [Mycobacteriales bacterium]
MYEVVRANDPERFTVRLLGIPTAAAVLIAVGLAAGYQHLASRASTPIVGYVSRWVSSPERALSKSDTPYWQVRLSNMGTGAAIFHEASWTVEPRGKRSTTMTSTSALQQALSELGLVDAGDFWIVNFSPGAVLAAAEERCYFECTRRMVEDLATFEVLLRFRSLFGADIEKRVSLLPHPGASSVVLEPSPSVAL